MKKVSFALLFILLVSLAFAVSPGLAIGTCDTLNGSSFDGFYESKGATIVLQTGETITIQAGEPLSDPAPEFFEFKVDSATNTYGIPHDTATYIAPSAKAYSILWWVPEGLGATWTVSCAAAGAPGAGAPGGEVGPAYPFFQIVEPALGVDLDKARQTPDEKGVLPLDVFEPQWWGVKIISASKFPLLKGLDLSDYEVRCLNNKGQWISDHVNLWSSTSTQLSVKVQQHGTCGIFPK